ncbi:probable serine/threonine-protein kinase pknB [Lentisphaera araneosa HTCC2155]|uniref:Probable serine/threonine-protein kinase pknB n=1 Tax=Lentisphaera araneosa HTCC2155 TaxID=313628 RepID=A6DGE8_9BACT|nr:serine/threonine-protein kinase [Lentisphaera araneosa]EDM29265.1 probable serine/threonine-protein kinase pknB [Lentisphaera araneosa HTCC2155]
MSRLEEGFDKKFADFYDEVEDSDEMPLLDMLETIKNRYTDFEYVDEGGIKAIKTCRDLKTGRIVAMASLKNDASDLEKEAFLREARLTATLQHPNIIPMHDLGLKGRHPWFTMKFISGSSLEQILKEIQEGKSFQHSDLSDRLDVFIKVCDAIAYAHSRGVLHLDIKPDNIQISEYGDVLLCDWGLAKVMASVCDEDLLEYYSFNPKDTHLTLDGVIKGTPGYMAPEQTPLVKNKKGVHTDIFSLGCVLYKILTFQKPFRGKDLDEIMTKTANCDFRKPSEIDSSIPLSLEAVCLKAMSMDPKERYVSVVNLQRDILNYRNGFATRAENATLVKLMSLWFKRHKAMSLAVSLLVLISLFTAFFAVNNLKLEKINALQLAEKLSLEKEFHVKMGKDAAPRFFNRAQIAYNTFNFDDAVNFCDSAVELDPSLKEAWSLKGLLHLIYQEFDMAIQAFHKGGQSPKLLNLSEDFLKIKAKDENELPLNQLVNLFRQTMDEGLLELAGSLIHYTAYSEMPVEKRIEYCKAFLIAHNKKTLERYYKGQKINFIYDAESRHLDVSNNRWMHTALILQNFPALSANLSHTGINNFICFRNQPLQYLDVSHTEIIELHTLENDDLRELNLAHTGVVNLVKLNQLSIRKLNVSHTAIRSLAVFQGFKGLDELIIHEGQFKLEALKAYLPETEIIVVP